MSLSALYVRDDIVLNAGIRCSWAVLRQIQDLELSLDVKLMKLSFLFGCSFVGFVGSRSLVVSTLECDVADGYIAVVIVTNVK